MTIRMILGLAVAFTGLAQAVPSATLGSSLSAAPTASENFDGFAGDAGVANPFATGGLVFDHPENTGFFIYPGNGNLGFSTNSLYVLGGMNGLIQILNADESDFEEITFSVGNGTGSADPNDYVWIRTYRNSQPTGHDFDFTAPRGSTFTIRGGGFDEVRVGSYTTATALAAHDESTFGAPAVDNVAAVKSLPVQIQVRPSANPRSSGQMQVALLGSEDVPISSVNWSSVRFGATGSEAHIEGYSLRDVNGDSRPDVVLRFRASSTNLTCHTGRATLKGRLISGSFFAGSTPLDSTRGCM